VRTRAVEFALYSLVAIGLGIAILFGLVESGDVGEGAEVAAAVLIIVGGLGLAFVAFVVQRDR
jgi:hypothetical protein